VFVVVVVYFVIDSVQNILDIASYRTALKPTKPSIQWVGNGDSVTEG